MLFSLVVYKVQKPQNVLHFEVGGTRIMPPYQIFQAQFLGGLDLFTSAKCAPNLLINTHQPLSGK